MVEDCRQQLQDSLGIPGKSALLVSAKDGTGVSELFEAIVTLVPPPKGSASEPLKCLIFDSFYDTYRGVIPHIRIFFRQSQARAIKS